MLRSALLLIAILYFGSGFAKIVHGNPIEWATATSLGRHIRSSHYRLGIEPVAGQLLLDMPDILIALGALTTLILEVGLLIVLIFGLPLTIVVLGLIGFHVGVYATQGPIFLDMIIVLLFFMSWDKIHSYISTGKSIDLVYDEHCYFCARSLYAFKLLDLNKTVNFYTQYNTPAEYRERENVNFDDEMYVFADGNVYRGYHAFRRLFKQFAVTAPLSWFMTFPPVAAVGKRIYTYIAKNRDRHFVCSYDPSEQS
ncbi:DUF393 domain-containing protein [Natronococcus sp. A-GB7]|uniref:DUF393 domain-containing protein n=1 Tax=Natronococcus sp. A-GB7 TaxID=3037649 RepID=UPI00241FE509|nr:DUF393 domain-containing protein [Natronococcus sp. A-GB7]MDG5820190.1 DUF393 domain-containing protein [Natronococcus sp. A-GB7]